MERKEVGTLYELELLRTLHEIPQSSGIYMLEFPNKMKYIGQSVNLQSRLIAWGKADGNKAMDRAIRREGTRNVKVYILHIFPKSIPRDSLKTLLDSQEDSFIRKEDSLYPRGFNMKTNNILYKPGKNPYDSSLRYIHVSYEGGKVLLVLWNDIHWLAEQFNKDPTLLPREIPIKTCSLAEIKDRYGVEEILFEEFFPYCKRGKFLILHCPSYTEFKNNKT